MLHELNIFLLSFGALQGVLLSLILFRNRRKHSSGLYLTLLLSLNDQQMQEFNKRGLSKFDEFLLQLTDDRTELEKMVVVAIQRLGSSFAIGDLHIRIAEICSILESLLLVNETNSMTDVVCKYFCRLVHSNPQKRKELDKLYRKFYSVRSAWVHHAKKISFEIAELAYLQRATHALILVLMSKTKMHTEKQTLLAEIDESLYHS